MRELLDANDLAANLMMQRSSDTRVFLIVEGDSDVRAITRCINETQCTTFAAYGRKHVLDAMQIVSAADPDGTVAIVDRDFGHWLQEQLPPNVFTSEYYDREVDLLLTGGLASDYVDALAEGEKATSLLDQTGEVDLVAILVRISSSIGRLRWLSVSQQLRLQLAKFPVANIVDADTLVNIDELLTLALKRSDRCAMNIAGLRTLYEAPDRSSDLRDFCCGHDLTAALAASSTWWAKTVVGKKEIRNFIVGAVRCDVLQKLRWFHDLDRWANSRGRSIWKCSR